MRINKHTNASENPAVAIADNVGNKISQNYFSIVVTKLNVNNIKICVFFLLSYSVFDFIFSLFFVSGPCARLSWPSRQLLSAL